MIEQNTTLAIMFVAQGLLSVALLFLGFILVGIRGDLRIFKQEFQNLNNMVLAGYTTRPELDSRMLAIRAEAEVIENYAHEQVHEIRNELHEIQLACATKGIDIRRARRNGESVP